MSDLVKPSEIERQWEELSLNSGQSVIIRVDGRDFSKYLRPYRPFDWDHSEAMIVAAMETAKMMGGFILAYTQSDECSFIISDEIENRQPWLNYRVQKINSLVASSFSVVYSLLMSDYKTKQLPAVFDARVWPALQPFLSDYLKERIACSINNSIISAYTQLMGRSKVRKLPSLSAMSLILEEEGCHIKDRYKFGTILIKNKGDFGRINPGLLPENELDNLVDAVFKQLNSKAQEKRSKKKSRKGR